MQGQAVQLAFVSDVHSNIHALEAVLDHARGEGAEQVLCAGDIVGYNARPNECIALLRKQNVSAVMGNHDWAATDGETEGFNPYAVAGVEHSRRALSEENKRWLLGLPRGLDVEMGGARVAVFHGSPRDPLFEYVFPTVDGKVLKELAKAAGNPQVVALGHTHLPMRLSAKADKGPLFVNPGSVGQPRDGDPRSSYLLLDTQRLTTAFHRVPYDVEAAAADVRAAGLPEFLWQRLLKGL